MGEALNSLPLTGVAAAIAHCMGIDAPETSEEPIAAICDMCHRTFTGRKAGRMLLYNPDAIGMWLVQKYTADFAPVLLRTQLALPLRTALPSITPVCFATMYTGASPEVHGVDRKFDVKPVVRTDSLFDALIRAGKRAAIVAVEGCSMSRLYLERSMDYYFLPYDGEVNEKALELIERNEHDLIAVYNQEYDDVMHHTWPESPEALRAMRNHIATFSRLADAANTSWAGYDRLVGFMTDHGIHTGENGRGTHGEAIPEDMNIMHFFGTLEAR